jgi:hypothetical protein
MIRLLILKARGFIESLLSLHNVFIKSKMFSTLSSLLILIMFLVGLFALWQGLHDLVKLILSIQFEGVL